ncbi:MAG TPA: mercuric reductase [Acidobacteriaceae bacterium]|nr:mercuric reductase [Acidobacteriaceae bacterium]
MSQEAAAHHYDAVILGSGQGGNPLAKALAQAGWRTALIERKYVGGTCVNTGCTPTKTMVGSARVAYMSGRGEEFGIHAQLTGVNMARIRQRKDEIVLQSRSNNEKTLRNTKNLDLIYGAARFTGPKSIFVKKNDGEELSLTADKIIIDTGMRPTLPSISGFDQVQSLPNVLDNASIMELDQLPEHLLVLGGGYVGLEFGQMFRRFGSRVTIVQANAQLLTHEDSDIVDEITKILREDGIDVLLNAKAQGVSGDENKITLEIQVGRERRAVEGSHLLVAVGRTPNTDELNLPAAGIETDDKGFLRVNSRLEANVPGVYGIGDVKGGPAFTHISYDDFRILRANLLEGKDVTIDGRILPYTVFIDPQLGRVGITEKEAKEQGKNIRVAKMPMSYVARAREFGETRGLMKVIVDAESDQILGAAILGMEGGEIAAMVQLAMMGKLPYPVLKEGIFAHPTLSESLNVIFGHFEA